MLRDVEQEGEAYGRSDYGKGEKVMVEFVSANPTGPMHMGNARGGALGDCLAAVLEAAGYDVWREFYVNDAGNQIEKFGAFARGPLPAASIRGEDAVPFPEDGYHGDDITRARRSTTPTSSGRQVLLEVPAEERRKALVDYALPKNIARTAERDLKTIPHRIRPRGSWRAACTRTASVQTPWWTCSRNKGLTYEKDGRDSGTRATSYTAAEKDEVLVRQNGNPTYFAADIAYHRNKFATRGF